MDSDMKIKEMKLNKHLLTITLDNAILDKKADYLILRERESKKEVKSKFELMGKSELVINLNDLTNFSLQKKSIIDIYIYKEDVKQTFRLSKNVPELKDRSFSYLTNTYKLDSKIVAVPYLTKKNELSLLVGSKGQIYRSYCTFIQDNMYLDLIESDHDKFVINFSNLNIQQVDDFYFSIQNRKNKKDSQITSSTVMNDHTVQLDLFERKWKLKERYDLFLYIKTNNIIRKCKVYINENKLISKNYPLVEVEDSLKVQPYITVKGEVAFFVLNDWLYEYEVSNRIINDLLVERIDISNELLIFKFSDPLESLISEFDYINLTIKSTKNSDSFSMDSQYFNIDKNVMVVNMKAIISKYDFKEKVKWDFYLKGHRLEQCNHTVSIFKLRKQSVFSNTNTSYLEQMDFSYGDSLITYISPKKAIGFLIGDRNIRKNLTYKKVDSRIAIENILIGDNKLEFDLRELDFKKVEYAKIILTERKSKNTWSDELTIQSVNDNGKVIVDLQSFCEEYQYTNSRWDLSLELYYEKMILVGKIGCFNQEVLPKHFRYFNEINRMGNKVIVPYLTTYNELSLVINEASSVNNEKITAKVKLIEFNMKNALIHAKSVIEVPEATKGFSISSVLVKYRGKADDNIEYPLPVEVKELADTKREVSFNMDVTQYEFLPFYWDIYLVVNIDNVDFPVKIKNPAPEVKKQIDQNIDAFSYTFENQYFIYPYISQANTLALTYREKPVYEGKAYKIKEKLAYQTYRIFKKYLDKKDIWLAYEKFSEGAQDNGYYFFKYAYENKKKKDFYYIIKKDSPDYENVKNMEDKVVEFMSFKYMVLMYAAKLLISSESKGHAYDIRIQKGKLKEALDKKKHVFLQHGVTALKRVDYVFKKTKNNAVDLFVATSDYEKNIIKKYFNYNDDEIITTGFCRWDVLEDKSEGNKEIFVMPTWRTWMDDLPEEQFLDSDYYKNYVGFFKSERLKKILAKSNVKLSFYIHPKFKSYIDQFHVDNSNIKIYQYGEEKVNELLMKSSMLITDYSSVAWEMFYQKKPVVFFQFDVDKYTAFQGSYLDMETELFGDRVFDVDSLVNVVEEYIGQDFSEKSEYGNLRNKYFKYVDNKNSERTYKAIRAWLKRLSQKQQKK